jgi:hypothetical protein
VQASAAPDSSDAATTCDLIAPPAGAGELLRDPPPRSAKPKRALRPTQSIAAGAAPRMRFKAMLPIAPAAAAATARPAPPLRHLPRVDIGGALDDVLPPVDYD